MNLSYFQPLANVPTVIRQESLGLEPREDCGMKRRGWFGYS